MRKAIFIRPVGHTETACGLSCSWNSHAGADDILLHTMVIGDWKYRFDDVSSSTKSGKACFVNVGELR